MLNWKKILLGYISLLVLGFIDSLRGPVYPDLLIDLNLSDTWGSMFFILVSLLAMFSGQITAEFARNYGLANAMRAGHAFVCFGTLGISQSYSFVGLAVACSLFGIGFGFINVGQNFLIIEGAKPKRRRQLLSGLHSIYAFAALIAPLVVSYMNYVDIHWRTGFLAVSVLPAVAFLSTFIIKDRDRLKPEIEVEERGFIRGLSDWKNYYLYATVISLYVAAELGLCTRLVLYLRREHAVSDVIAPQYLTGFFICLLIGRLTFALVPFSKWSSHKIISTSMLVSTACLLLGILFSPYWLVLCGLTFAPIFGYYLDYLAELFPHRSNAAIASVLAMSSIYIISMHFIIGLVTEYSSIGQAMFVCPLLLIIAFGVFQFLPRSGPIEEN